MRYASYTETYNPHEYHLTTIQCPRTMGGCGTTQTISVPAPALFAYNQGGSLQRAFPHLSAAERERLMSGFCDPCFQKLFATALTTNQ